jgi:DNA-binding NtrC family response regulator
MTLNILIASEGNVESENLKSLLEEKDVSVTLCDDGKEVFKLAESGKFDSVIMETVLKNFGGKELITELLSKLPDLPIIIRTSHASVDDAFNLARIGVRLYSSANEDIGPFLEKVINITSGRELTSDNNEESSVQPFSQYNSKNIETVNVFKTAIERVAKTPSTVLISGESGTGKELLAKTIHNHSERSGAPLVTVNCAALPENLLESELFGHEKGAFTGAVKKRIGRFEQANGGTFFLDEIGDLSLPLQAKLLRVIQEKTFERVGGNLQIKVDVRLIAATHRNLKLMIKNGNFREDLFYRLSVINLEIPPLRKRAEDVPGLSRFFLEKFRRKAGREPMTLLPNAILALKGYSWPGNVRELENVIERTVVLTVSNQIDYMDLPGDVRTQAKGIKGVNVTLKEAREYFEKDYITKGLILHGGNVSVTSEYLSIARKNLQEKIKRYEINIRKIRAETENKESE